LLALRLVYLETIIIIINIETIFGYFIWGVCSYEHQTYLLSVLGPESLKQTMYWLL